MVNMANSLKIIDELPSPFEWLDFAEKAWPQHPAFKADASPAQRKRDLHRLQVRTSTWLGRLSKNGLVFKCAALRGTRKKAKYWLNENAREYFGR